MREKSKASHVGLCHRQMNRTEQNRCTHSPIQGPQEALEIKSLPGGSSDEILTHFFYAGHTWLRMVSLIKHKSICCIDLSSYNVIPDDETNCFVHITYST